MEFNYKYTTVSNCTTSNDTLSLNLSYDLSRGEKVSFVGKLKKPLVFRDALLMLREIVTLDTRIKKISRPDFFIWLTNEIERQALLREADADLVRQNILSQMQPLYDKLAAINDKLTELNAANKDIVSQIEETDAWKDYYKLERQFWNFLKSRDYNLWFVLDPVITVHKDIVSFEAFSIDESVYGNLSIPMEEFELLQTPQLGTTNIDFSDKLATEINRFRTYNDVTLSINPEGLEVASNSSDSYIEKKIDLPDSWIKGFNQVSSAAILPGVCVDLSPVDIYDLCSFIKRYKAHQSPRFMKWILMPNKPVQIIFEPSKTKLTLQAIYQGKKAREEKIWGRNRWLVLEKLIPLAASFTIKLQGFGMPQFVIAHIGEIAMTIGFSSWSRNDWVKGTAFNIMAGFIGNECYDDVYKALWEKRKLTLPELSLQLPKFNVSSLKSGLGQLFKRGEGYYDFNHYSVRFRQLYNIPLPDKFYESSSTELDVQNLLAQGMDRFKINYSSSGEYTFSNHYLNSTSSSTTPTHLVMDSDGNITQVSCTCHTFYQGARNISSPCPHILALYLTSTKFLSLELEADKTYKINDIMEILL